ncbi:phosphatidic acid phosphatase type 2/haloperoxidase, partial [Epithele typhae]|uniref:phosphatidic acid phosphatase type 2/haloperoxidase n=1 Tax=Epithele typhae TaxID=378194 RepID=UPI00200742BB
AAFFGLNFVPGFRREFSLTDTSLMHTFAEHERVPPWLLYVIFAGGPLILMPVINLLSVRSWWDFHSSYLGWLLSTSITGCITQFVKVTVGRPRPDLIDRCQPVTGAADPSFGLSTSAICTQTSAKILKDGFRSFPSGHSSLSFAGLGFLAFYLAGKLHLFDKRGHSVKAWLSLAPLSGAALVAISRTMDYRHHWQDVLTGSVLGLTIAYFSYRQYYPMLEYEASHLPYPPRPQRGGRDRPRESQIAFGSEGAQPGHAALGGRSRNTDSRYTDHDSVEDLETGVRLEGSSNEVLKGAR